MSTQQHNRFMTRSSYICLTILIVACCGAAQAQAPAQAKPKAQYNVSTLASLGGTSSGGNSINDQSWVAGYSRLPDRNRHAALWRNGLLTRPRHTRRTKQQCHMEREKYRGNHRGYFPNCRRRSRSARAGVARLSTVRLTTSAISISGSFGKTGQMRDCPIFLEEIMALPPEPTTWVRWSGGRRMAFMTPTVASRTQVLQFRPAVWTLGPPDQIHELPLIPGDSSGAATAINDNGQIVGISGICDQAVGRHTAKHAVLWENGAVTDIGNHCASSVVEYADGNQSTRRCRRVCRRPRLC